MFAFFSAAISIFIFLGKRFQYLGGNGCHHVEVEMISWEGGQNKASGEMVDSPEANSTIELK